MKPHFEPVDQVNSEIDAVDAAFYEALLAAREGDPHGSIPVPVGPAAVPGWVMSEEALMAGVPEDLGRERYSYLIATAGHPNVPRELISRVLDGESLGFDEGSMDRFTFVHRIISNRHVAWSSLRALVEHVLELSVSTDASAPPPPGQLGLLSWPLAPDVLLNEHAPPDLVHRAVGWVVGDEVLRGSGYTLGEALSHGSLSQADFERLIDLLCVTVMERPDVSVVALMEQLVASDGWTVGSRGEVPLGGRCTPLLVERVRSALVVAAAAR